MTEFTDLMNYLKEPNVASIIFRFIIALICGGVIGLDRGRKSHAAGLRTHLLVCLGATAVMIVNQYIAIQYPSSTDVSRMGAQVISGIGFLGAGTILVTGQRHIKGLTTAAGLWACACMGLAIGIGFYSCAIILCILLFLVLQLLNRLDAKYIKYNRHADLYLEYEPEFKLSSILKALRQDGWHIDSIEYLTKSSDGTGSLQIGTTNTNAQSIDVLLEKCRAKKGLSYIEQL